MANLDSKQGQSTHGFALPYGWQDVFTPVLSRAVVADTLYRTGSYFVRDLCVSHERLRQERDDALAEVQRLRVPKEKNNA